MKHISEKSFFAGLGSKALEKKLPQSFTFELTYGCNLRCVHCYNPTHQALPQELSTSEIFSILDQSANLGVASVCFSGGELFVRPDIFQILGYAKRLGFFLESISNATRITSEVALQLQELGLRDIAISIYGATKETYEGVTRVPGSYGKFLAGIACLAERNLPVVVRMPVMTGNVHEVREAQALIEGMGIKFQYCLDISPKSDGDTGPLAYRLSPVEKIRIDSEMAGYRDPAEVSSCGLSEEFISCDCGKRRFAVTPYGEMNLCVAFPTPKYDLRKGTVREGWEILRRIVAEAKPNSSYECPACPVNSNCRQGRNDAWLETGNMSACLPHYKEYASLERSLLLTENRTDKLRPIS